MYIYTHFENFLNLSLCTHPYIGINKYTYLCMYIRRSYLSRPPTRPDLTQGQWPKGQLKEGNWERECHALAHFVQCEPDEPSWTWIQIWVQAWMLDYSLNWTMRSSAILAGQWLLHAHPTKRSRGTQYVYKEVLTSSSLNQDEITKRYETYIQIYMHFTHHFNTPNIHPDTYPFHTLFHKLC